MSGMAGMDKKAPAANTGHDVGVITAIDTKTNKLTIQHGPIPAVGWPTMTMAFKANPSTLLRGLRWASGSGSTSGPKAWPPRSLPFDRNRHYLPEAGIISVRPPRGDVLQNSLTHGDQSGAARSAWTRKLNRWARYRPIGAEYAAISCLRAQHGTAAGVIV